MTNNNNLNEANYARKQEVIWYENHMQLSAGHKDWPSYSQKTGKTLSAKLSAEASEETDENLIKWLSDIKETIRSQDYNYSSVKNSINSQKATYIISYGSKELERIDSAMKHIGACRYHDDSDIYRLMLYAEFYGSKREQYSREYDRILVTKSFRHLQYKTQVMVNSASDDQRTRLLHSLEVQRIAKTLALQLGANSNLAQTIAIGHDVGHAPFGHAGEYALSSCLSKGYFGDFTHALQSVKVLNHIEKHPIVEQYGFRGLGLSVEVLSGILKHDTDTYTKDISSAAFRLQYECDDITAFPPCDASKKITNPKLTMGSLEAQIVYWADKIAYIGHDWEEFVLSSNIETLLYDTNNVWDKINVIYTAVQDKSTSAKDAKENSKTEIDRIGSIFNILKEMNGIYFEPKSKEQAAGNTISTPSTRTTLENLISELLNIREGMKKDGIECSLLNRNEYKLLFDFFEVAQAWMYITNRIPRKYKDCNDIVYILYRYLKDTISQRSTPSLETVLIEEAREAIDGKSAQEIVQQSTEDWQKFFDNFEKNSNNATTDEEKTEQDRKKTEEETAEQEDPKKILRDGFLKALTVKLDKETNRNLDIIYRFKKQYYIGSKEVQNMTDTATMIIQRLFHYYLRFPEMLPDEWLGEYFSLVDGKKYEEYKKLVRQYLWDEAQAVLKREKTIYSEDNALDSSRLNAVFIAIAAERDKQKSDAAKLDIPEKLYKIIEGFIKTENQTNKNAQSVKDAPSIGEKPSLRKGRQEQLFNNDLSKYNKHLNPLASENHVSKTILARIIADYICSMTDRMAIMKYNEITTSTTTWTEYYKA